VASRRRTVAVIVSIAVAVFATVWGQHRALAGSPAVVVTLTDQLTFRPSKVTISVGQAVEWRNDSVLVHTVTADPEVAAKASDVALPDGAKTFDSGNLKPKARFRHLFMVPGTYRYFCTPHEAADMVGEVIVTP